MNSIAEIASSEERALFNQAFTAVVLHAAVTSHHSSTDGHMPAELAFLLIPLAFHKPTRSSLPTLASAQMQKWVRENPRHLVNLENRVIAMRPFVAAGVRFGIRHGVLVPVAGHLSPGSLLRKPRGFADGESTEVRDCVQTGKFLGRWFARQPDAATLLAMWGLRP